MRALKDDLIQEMGKKKKRENIPPREKMVKAKSLPGVWKS